MYGPTILARYLAQQGPPDKYDNRWQYHPRSDRHSKVGCWGVAFDLLRSSSLLQDHAHTGKVVMGVNHRMIDHSTGRSKDLDLVIARPRGLDASSSISFKRLVGRYEIPLHPREEEALAALPDIRISEVGAVLIALEAKAAMTEHNKARSRLYDELNSSHLTIHGASSQALAIAYIQVNAADRFVSPTRHPFPLGDFPIQITEHRQPAAAQSVASKVRELPRRSSTRDSGFDGVGITVLHLENLGGSVDIIDTPPAPDTSDPFEYGQMIRRMANEYDSIFARI